jgi:hypothetical protein
MRRDTNDSAKPQKKQAVGMYFDFQCIKESSAQIAYYYR